MIDYLLTCLGDQEFGALNVGKDKDRFWKIV